VDGLKPYKTLPVWDAHSLPEAFKRAHRTQAGTWAQLTVSRGWLAFEFLDAAGEPVSRHVFDAQRPPPCIAPQRWHKITETSADVQCQLQFLCTQADYFSKKHGLTRTHSEVLHALDTIAPAPGHILDAGCGHGRNALFLAARGFTVDAWDVNPERLDKLRHIADVEGLAERMHTRCVDFNAASALEDATARYDLALCTVVLMFLQPQAALQLVAHMQQTTKIGGYNLIVAAMDSQDYPCPGMFPFTFAPGQLHAAYAGWEVHKYNEDVGQLHRKDAQGNFIQLRFATLLTRKRSNLCMVHAA